MERIPAITKTGQHILDECFQSFSEINFFYSSFLNKTWFVLLYKL